MPNVDQIEDIEQTKSERGNAGNDVGDQQHLSLIKAIGDLTALKREEWNRQELQRGHDAERGSTTGELENQPVLSNALRPGSGVGDDVGGVEAFEV